MILFEHKKQCCGCTACRNVCPVSAISFEEDKEGFLYPAINKEICIECGKCIEVCPFKDYKKQQFETKVYAVKHKDENVLYSSSSGGAFTAISDYILKNGGVIYGASFDEDMKVVHTRAEDAEQRNRMRGSKYVQSYCGGCFELVKRDLEEGKTVLFTGTPCLCAGLDNYLNKEYPNLFLCDIVCHGVPSPRVFQDYILLLRKRYKNIEINFRAKNNGWKTLTLKINNELYISSNKSPYYTLFLNNLILRPSCYNCKFSNFDRLSDVTIADFWGIEKCKPHMDDNKGVSLVLVNSEKGQNLFDSIKDTIYFEESNKTECLQHNLREPTPLPPNRAKFWEDYEKKGFNYVARKYTPYGLKYRIKRFVKKAVIYSLKKLRLYGFFQRIRAKSKSK